MSFQRWSSVFLKHQVACLSLVAATAVLDLAKAVRTWYGIGLCTLRSPHCVLWVLCAPEEREADPLATVPFVLEDS